MEPSLDQPQSVPQAAEQARALTTRVGVCPRRDRCLIEIHGADAVSWLNGQVTHDVRAPAPHQGVYALATTVKGRILADLWIAAEGDQRVVIAPSSARDILLESFDKYIIMEDVELRPRDDLRLLSIQGPRAETVRADLDASALGWAACDELGYGGYLLWAPEAAFEDLWRRTRARAEAEGGCAVSEAGWELARLRQAIPRFGYDFDSRHYPQEAGLKSRAVSFQKGCYLGQEVICMLENRGHVSRHLVQLRGQGPSPAQGRPDAVQTGDGAQLRLRHAGQDVGQITSGVLDPEADPPGLWLGYVKRAVAEPGTALEAVREDGITLPLRIERIVGEAN